MDRRSTRPPRLRPDLGRRGKHVRERIATGMPTMDCRGGNRYFAHCTRRSGTSTCITRCARGKAATRGLTTATSGARPCRALRTNSPVSGASRACVSRVCVCNERSLSLPSNRHFSSSRAQGACVSDRSSDRSDQIRSDVHRLSYEASFLVRPLTSSLSSLPRGRTWQPCKRSPPCTHTQAARTAQSAYSTALRPRRNVRGLTFVYIWVAPHE